jgi:hypothetical protein
MKGTGKYSHHYICDYCKENPCPTEHFREHHLKYMCDVCLMGWWAFRQDHEPLLVTGCDYPLLWIPKLNLICERTQ